MHSSYFANRLFADHAGDWGELKTDQFLVLTSEEHPMDIISMVTEAFASDRTEDADG